ncbi:MAG: hypothetical protein OIF34_02680 [Porticoccaceae bacterium]|nr:hypothetical protein [Porticoccaceae bacterium]
MTTITIPVLENPDCGPSVFTEQPLSLEDYNGLMISARIDALNFRHRASEPGYFSSWHMAGDATLILIRQGTLRIGLRDGSYRDFSAGDMFIAKDRLANGEQFNEQHHGHTAQVIGTDTLLALHIKLESI